MFEVSGVDTDPIYKSSVRGAKIAKEALRGSYLENAVVSGKEPVLRQAKLRILTSPDHESVVLVECEVASGLRTSNNVERYAH